MIYFIIIIIILFFKKMHVLFYLKLINMYI